MNKAGTDPFSEVTSSILLSLDHPEVVGEAQRHLVTHPEKDLEDEVKKFLSARFRSVERDEAFLHAVKSKLLEKLDELSANQLLTVLTKVQALSVATVDNLLKPFSAKDSSPLLESSRSAATTDEEVNKAASPDVLKAIAELTRFLEVLRQRGIEVRATQTEAPPTPKE